MVESATRFGWQFNVILDIKKCSVVRCPFEQSHVVGMKIKEGLRSARLLL